MWSPDVSKEELLLSADMLLVISSCRSSAADRANVSLTKMAEFGAVADLNL